MVAIRYILHISLMLMVTSDLAAQVANDECLISQFIPDVTNFCSGDASFTNVGATMSSDAVPSCWTQGDEQADVWYSFRPRNTGLLIRYFGEGDNGNNSLDNGAISIYYGNCGNLNDVLCSDVNDGRDDVLERVITDVVVGATYYIRISSASATAGTFELCIEEFTAIPLPESDCINSVPLCDKSTFFVDNLNSVGTINDLPSDGCIGPESASAWYTWTALNDGDLTFTLTPTGPAPDEDLDFIIFRFNNGINNCSDLEIVRCMASGETPGFNSTPCFGPTGLREGSTDITETAGCQVGDDNFLAPLQMRQGESYGLIVNNFDRSGFGFTMEFGGSADFLGPQPDFEVVADQGFECDQIITFNNLSVSATDQIVEYRWNFGDGAVPQTASGPGPHDVTYETFGDKLAALTVVTNRGCEVTDITDISITECCQIDELPLTAEIVAANCNGESNAAIVISAGSGTGLQLFSFEGSPLLPNNRFGGLAEGTYSYSGQDAKGCMGMGTIDIIDPPPVTLVLTATRDTVPLGNSTTLLGTAGPTDRTFTYTWSPIQGLSCTDCPDPSVIPPGTTTYTLTATDQLGCNASADLTLFTIDIKNFYAPNAIQLSSINNNRFKVFGNIAIAGIELLEVYDRWGNSLYSLENFNVNDPNYLGWDGTVNGQKVNTGVYVWIAKVVYIDGEVESIAGDLTVFD